MIGGVGEGVGRTFFCGMSSSSVRACGQAGEEKKAIGRLGRLDHLSDLASQPASSTMRCYVEMTRRRHERASFFSCGGWMDGWMDGG